MLEEVRDVVGGSIVEGLVDQQQDLALNPGGHREPVQLVADGHDMLIPRSAGQEGCSRVLNRLKLKKSFAREFCKQALANVQSERHEGIDQTLG